MGVRKPQVIKSVIGTVLGALPGIVFVYYVGTKFGVAPYVVLGLGAFIGLALDIARRLGPECGPGHGRRDRLAQRQPPASGKGHGLFPQRRQIARCRLAAGRTVRRPAGADALAGDKVAYIECQAVSSAVRGG